MFVCSELCVLSPLLLLLLIFKFAKGEKTGCERASNANGKIQISVQPTPYCRQKNKATFIYVLQQQQQKQQKSTSPRRILMMRLDFSAFFYFFLSLSLTRSS